MAGKINDVLDMGNRVRFLQLHQNDTSPLEQGLKYHYLPTSKMHRALQNLDLTKKKQTNRTKNFNLVNQLGSIQFFFKKGSTFNTVLKFQVDQINRKLQYLFISLI